MADLKWTERPLRVRLGRVATATLAGQSMFLIRHRDLAVYRVVDDNVDVWHEPVDPETRVQLDERNMQVALDEQGVLYTLLADGSVWTRVAGAPLRQVAPPDLRLAGHYAHRTGFVWDPKGQRLVVIGGDHRNDAYALESGAGSFVPLPYGPAHGVGQTVGTPHGVFHLIADELHRLEGSRWTLVARHGYARADRGQLLFWDPVRDALFVVVEARRHPHAPRLVQLNPAGPTEPLTLPGSFQGPLEAHEAVAQIDPRSGRLWLVDTAGSRTLDTQTLIGEAGSPVVPLAHSRSIVQAPPLHWYRETLALRQRDDEAPPLDVPVRDGWVLSATFPVSPHLPLGDAGSLLLFCREMPYDYEPWTLGYTNAFEVRIVDEVFPLTAGGMQVEQLPYREVEPIYAEQVDTAHDGAANLARGSKIGGFPALVQGTKEEAANSFVADLRCEDCDTRLRFVAQLAWPEWDLISAVVYIYACPFGHMGAAHAMNV